MGDATTTILTASRSYSMERKFCIRKREKKRTALSPTTNKTSWANEVEKKKKKRKTDEIKCKQSMPPHTYASMYIQFNLVLSHRFFSRRLFAFFESTTFFSCFQQICCCCCCSELMFSLSLECLHTQQYSGNQLAKMSLQIVVPHVHSSWQQPFFFYFCLFTVLRVHNIVMAIYKVLFKS